MTRATGCLIVALTCGACTFTRPLEWGVVPTGAPPCKVPMVAGVILDASLVGLVEKVHPSGLRGSLHMYKFPVGTRLGPTIVAVLEAHYERVALLDSQPKPGEVDLAFRFVRDSSKLTIAQIPGLFSDKENGSYVIRIRAEAIDGSTTHSLQHATITGRGVSTKSWDHAIQEAVQELSDHLTGLLHTDFGMPPAVGADLPAAVQS
jgi:hypothetical protein